MVAGSGPRFVSNSRRQRRFRQSILHHSSLKYPPLRFPTDWKVTEFTPHLRDGNREKLKSQKRVKDFLRGKWGQGNDWQGNGRNFRNEELCFARGMRRGDQAIIYAFLTTHFETSVFQMAGKVPEILRKSLKIRCVCKILHVSLKEFNQSF